MGVLTGRKIKRIEGTGRGSDYWGGCERCGKPMSEAFRYVYGDEYRRESGELYDNAHAVSYGHKECLMLDYGKWLKEDG
jgi:hypothetical protein